MKSGDSTTLNKENILAFIVSTLRKNKQRSTTSLIITAQCTSTQYNVH